MLDNGTWLLCLAEILKIMEVQEILAEKCSST